MSRRKYHVLSIDNASVSNASLGIHWEMRIGKREPRTAIYPIVRPVLVPRRSCHSGTVPLLHFDHSLMNKLRRLCSACCCMIASLYLRFPGCLCCYEKTTCFCCESESVCFESANCYLVRPKVFFKVVSQVMLLDLRCAIPTDDEIPCACMPFPFVTCCANGVCRFACCASMETLQGQTSSI